MTLLAVSFIRYCLESVLPFVRLSQAYHSFDILLESMISLALVSSITAEAYVIFPLTERFRRSGFGV
ncbi:hypothetical protein Lser_V15G05126 [Lactuca serriola]